MTLTPIHNMAIVVNTIETVNHWCVFEHQAVMTPGEPPVVIMVGACRLGDVFKLHHGKTNSEWIKVFDRGGEVLVRIVATTLDKGEAMREARRLVNLIQPFCNLRGYDRRYNRKQIMCISNGKVYGNQAEAAKDLGLSQSGISRHLLGELNHVGGYKFKYEVDA